MQAKFREPLGVLRQMNNKGSPDSLGKPSFPEIPVKLNKEGHLEVNNSVSVAVQSEPTECVDKVSYLNNNKSHSLCLSSFQYLRAFKLIHK